MFRPAEAATPLPLGDAVEAARVEALAPRAVPSSECVHCGLPLGRRPVHATIDGERVRCCCYGCVLALQVTRARGEHGAAAVILVRLGLAIFFALNVMMLSMPSYVPYVYGPSAGAVDGPLFQVLRVLAMLLAFPVLVLLGWPVLASGWQGLRGGLVNADALIILATLAAYALSVANTLAQRPAVYFDTAAMLLVFVTLGRYLEASARAEAGAAVRATLAPAPPEATRVRAGAAELVSPAVLRPGEVVRVAPGAAFPTDGVVLEGRGGVDEAMLTGESRPVAKEPGSAVASGTCSVDALFMVRVTLPARESAAARVSALVAAAARQRCRAQRLADRLSSGLVPAVVALAGGAGAYWTMRSGIDQGVLVALAVLVVACPCPLGLATPVALWTGLVTAARRGVVVRSAQALERAAAIERVLFDKTGTLTSRTPRLLAIERAVGAARSGEEILARVAALEASLAHPLARAVAAAWSALPGECPDAGAGLGATRPPSASAADVRIVPGRGVRGTVDGAALAVGSPAFAAEELGGDSRELRRLATGEGTVVVVLEHGRLLGALRFAEEPTPEASGVVAALRRLGVTVGLLSGDRRAGAVVPALVSHEDAKLGLGAEEKVAWIRRLRGYGAVAMVGDGINDAPALAAADLGIAVAGATDLARITADVAVIGSSLDRIPWLLAHARRVRRIVRQSLGWAFAYNAVAVALAVAGRLNPLVASAAMLASSAVVVMNARRLRRA